VLQNKNCLNCDYFDLCDYLDFTAIKKIKKITVQTSKKSFQKTYQIPKKITTFDLRKSKEQWKNFA